MLALNLGPVQIGDRPSSVQSAVPKVFLFKCLFGYTVPRSFYSRIVASSQNIFFKWPCLEACLVDLVESCDDDHSIEHLMGRDHGCFYSSYRARAASPTIIWSESMELEMGNENVGCP